MESPWVINFDHDFADLGAQHALYLKNASTPGLFGVAEGRGPGVPKTTSVVEVDRTRCLRIGPAELACTIAHELAHGSCVWHHGNTDYRIQALRKRDRGGTWRSRPVPGGGSRVGARGGQHSGVEECVMRYDGTDLYEAPGGSYRWPKPPAGTQVEGEWYPPGEDPGASFCDKQEGTGVNDPAGVRTSNGRRLPKAGNPTTGKCRRQLCVNDHKH